MSKKKLIIRTTSYNFWWTNYGLSECAGWEDMWIFDENGNYISFVCVQTLPYLEATKQELEMDNEFDEYYNEVTHFLKNKNTYYKFYYADKNDIENFYELPFNAPKNDKGIKPTSFEIWINRKTLNMVSAIFALKEFAKDFLGINDCQIGFEKVMSLDEALKNIEKETVFNQVEFSNDVVNKLSKALNLSKEHVIEKLKRSLS